MKTLEKNRHIRTKNPFKRNWNGIPAMMKRTLVDVTLKESFAMSLLWHLVGFLIIWLLVFCLTFFGITYKIFPKPKPKIQDIEFIIKDTSAPRIKPKKAPVSNKDTNAAPAALKKEEKKTKPSFEDMMPKNIFAPKKENISKSVPNKTSKGVQKSSKHSKSAKSATAGTSHSKGVPDDFSMPMPKIRPLSSGSGGSGGSRHRASGFDSSSSEGSETGSLAGRGSTGGSGFDKTTTRKIISDYDISPYISELRRNIRWNWKAPKGYDNKRVELFLRIAKDGRVVILNVKRTSEVSQVDNAALDAVRKTQPLNPLPSGYKKGFLDVVFSFDSASSSISSR